MNNSDANEHNELRLILNQDAQLRWEAYQLKRKTIDAALDDYSVIEILDDDCGDDPILFGLGYNDDDQICLLKGVFEGESFVELLVSPITLKEACQVKVEMDNLQTEFLICPTEYPDMLKRFYSELAEALP